MTSSGSLIFAQSLLAAITLTYGSAFLGLWLQYRRRAMRAFAVAWIGLGLYSAWSIMYVVVHPDLERLSPALDLALVCAEIVLGTATAVAILHAVYSVVAPTRSRRGLLIAAIVAVVILLAIAVKGGEYASIMRLVVMAALVHGMVSAWRAAPSPGRLSMFAALGLLVMRPAFGLLAVQWQAGTQPTWYSVLQVIVSIGSGFFVTVAVFAVEREASLRERAALDRIVAESQRLESMGRMARSVAHDFNNILTAILATGGSDALEGTSPAERDAAAREVDVAVARGNELTRQLLSFARPQVATAELFDASARLAALLPMAQRVAGNDVRLVGMIHPAAGAPPAMLRADPVQFDQVLLNLVANARDATRTDGVITVGSEMLPAGRRDQLPAGVPPGDYFVVTVSDTGSGIAADIRDRIFEPYFTTKPDGRGTGLGLASVFTFVRTAGGFVTLDSAVGVGSTFVLYFPLAQG